MLTNTYKIIKTGVEAREAIKSGLDQVAEVISKTLGPAGRNVITEWKGGKPPLITNDGVSTAKRIILKDEIENLGAQAMIEVAVRTSSQVGDGTTTSVVLTKAIVDEAMKRMDEDGITLGQENNVMDIKREIEENCEKAIEELKKQAKHIKTREEMEEVAIGALEDEKLGKLVAEMIEKIGVDGYISVDENFGYETYTEVISGMKFHGNYIKEIGAFLVTNNKREAEVKDPLIMITDCEVEDQQDLQDVCEELIKAGVYEVVLIAPKFNKNIWPFIIVNRQKKRFNLMPVCVPALTPEQLEDIAVYTGGKFLSRQAGFKWEAGGMDYSKADFGKAEKIVINMDDVVIFKGAGDKKETAKRIKKLKEERKIEKTDMFKKKIDQRIASLAGGVGIIKVACNTQIEQGYLKLKVENAVNATKVAVEEGVVKGGGVALKEIAEKMEDNILKEALKAPYNTIQENSGGKLKINPKIVDPVKVTRTALKNACSLAGVFITTETAMADKRFELDEVLGILGLDK